MDEICWHWVPVARGYDGLMPHKRNAIAASPEYLGEDQMKAHGQLDIQAMG
jgi:hypothetical protein